MPEILSVPKATDFDFPLTLIDPDTGADFPVGDSTTLTAKIWMGDDLSPLFSPTLLLDRPIGNTDPTANVILRILKTQTTTLEPGDYKGQAYGDDGTTYKALFGADGIILRITANPGTATARTSWISWDQVQRFCETAGILQNIRVDQYGFLEQRADATDELKRMIIKRAHLRPGYTRRRLSTYHEVHGYDVPSLENPPSKATISATMDANRLKVDGDCVEMLAILAIRRILDDNLTDNPRTNPYTEFVSRSDVRLKELFHCWDACLDLDNDQVYDVLINIDATFLGDP